MLTSNVFNPELTTETLLSSVRRLWVSSQHGLRGHGSVSLERIAQEPYIMLTVDEAARTTQRYWSQAPHQPKVTIRTSSVEAVRSMVGNGLGVTILSDMVYRPWSLEGRRIETVHVSDFVPSMDVGLAWRKDTPFTPAMSAFRDYFRATFQTPTSRHY